MTDFDTFWTTANTQLTDFNEEQARWLWRRAQEAQEQRISELESINADILATVDQFLRDEGYSDAEVGEFLCPLVMRLKEPPK